jgi:hypothetical protein
MPLPMIVLLMLCDRPTDRAPLLGELLQSPTGLFHDRETFQVGRVLVAQQLEARLQLPAVLGQRTDAPQFAHDFSALLLDRCRSLLRTFKVRRGILCTSSPLAGASLCLLGTPIHVEKS